MNQKVFTTRFVLVNYLTWTDLSASNGFHMSYLKKRCYIPWERAKYKLN
jgi:hypothetical protein